MGGLQVEPELRAVAKEMAEPQGGITCDGALAVDDRGNAVGRHVQLPTEFGRTHAQCFELFGEMFARVDCGACHDDFLSGNRRSRR